MPHVFLYTHAPRLPEGDAIDAASLLRVDVGPLEIEIGPGRGGFLYERLQACPEARMIGLEIRRKWATIVDERLRARGLGDRARVFSEDAREALGRLAPDGCVSRFFVHFPDPWWKKRHAKRLVVGDALLAQMVRLLADGGELYVQTDVEDRAEQYLVEVSRFAVLVPDGDAPGSPVVANNPYGARSNREHRADDDGLPVHRMRWRRVPRGAAPGATGPAAAPPPSP